MFKIKHSGLRFVLYLAFQADLFYLFKLGLSMQILEILAQRKLISAECQAYSNFTKRPHAS